MGQGFNTFAGGLAGGYQQGAEMQRRNQESILAKAKDTREGEYYKKLGDIMDQWRNGQLPYQQQGPQQLAGPGGPPPPGPAAAGLASTPSAAAPTTMGGIIPNMTPQQQQKKALPFSDFMGF